MKISCLLTLLVANLAFGSDYGDTWGPAVGTSLPADGFTSHRGETRTFLGLTGDAGLLIFFIRSAEW